MKIKVVRQILEGNENCSEKIKQYLCSKNVRLINVMGSPGTGKTSLIISLIKKLREEYNIAVVEGDIAGKIDAEKIDALGIPVVQLNTDGECHIEASSIYDILQYFDLDKIDIIFIENIGNLVCPAEFNIGESMRIVVLSVPEGDDKIEKYPFMFSTADVLAINKFDMMEHFDFDDKKVEDNELIINPNSKIFRLSSTQGTGIEDLVKFIEKSLHF